MLRLLKQPDIIIINSISTSAPVQQNNGARTAPPSTVGAISVLCPLFPLFFLLNTIESKR
jgi:hypothetical protein